MTRPESDKEFVTRALSELPPCVPSAELRRRIAEIPLRAPKPSMGLRRWFAPALWAPAFGVASLALGVLAGFVTSEGGSQLGSEPLAVVDQGELNVESEGTEGPTEEASLENLLALAWGEESNAWEAAWTSE